MPQMPQAPKPDSYFRQTLLSWARQFNHWPAAAASPKAANLNPASTVELHGALRTLALQSGAPASLAGCPLVVDAAESDSYDPTLPPRSPA